MKKKWAYLLIVFSLSVLTGCNDPEIEIPVDAADIEVMQTSQLTVTPPSSDFGDIDRTKGKVSTTVLIKNTGEEMISLYRLSTSCGCTTAKMDMSDLAAGESREIVITFDPMTHPDLIGPLVRVVYLQTSDPNVPEIEIEIKGNVI